MHSAAVISLTDKPSEITGGRCILITSGISTKDEKVALILASNYERGGGIYFGYIYGTTTPEYVWKKVI